MECSSSTTTTASGTSSSSLTSTATAMVSSSPAPPATTTLRGQHSNNNQHRQQKRVTLPRAASGGAVLAAAAAAVNRDGSAQDAANTASNGTSTGSKAAPGNDIGSIVANSKKAAASIFTLLHAKSCRLGPYQCQHRGCAQAKLTYLHLKTCPSAGTTNPCPTHYKGCDESRKLLAHHRRCRDIRARQAGQNARLQKEHLCLVCTFVARQARGMLDRSSTGNGRNGSIITRKTNTKHVYGNHPLMSKDKTLAMGLSAAAGAGTCVSASPSTGALGATQDHQSGADSTSPSSNGRERRFVTSFRISEDGQRVDHGARRGTSAMTPPNTPHIMPPPPPRVPTTMATKPTSSTREALKIPTISPPMTEDESKDEDSAMALCMLGTSPPAPRYMQDNEDGAMALCMLGGDRKNGSRSISTTRKTRPRAESLDVRSTSKLPNYATAAQTTSLLGTFVESLDLPEDEEVVEVEQLELSSPQRRKRSASCSVIASISTSQNVSDHSRSMMEQPLNETFTETLGQFD